MNDDQNTKSEEERLNKFIEDRTLENAALKKLLEELSKDNHTTSDDNPKKNNH